ncbi:hypothetical protein D3C87_1876480 [compost metagenome]
MSELFENIYVWVKRTILKENKEGGAVLPFPSKNPTRVGSSTVGSGARGGT